MGNATEDMTGVMRRINEIANNQTSCRVMPERFDYQELRLQQFRAEEQSLRTILRRNNL